MTPAHHGSKLACAAGGIALLGGLAVALSATGPEPLGTLRTQVLLSLIGAAIGTGLAAILLRHIHVYRRLVICGLTGIAGSQIAFNVLVWSGLKTQAAPWRVWWVFMVASLFCTHIALLLAARRSGSDRVVDLAAWSAFAAALAIAGLALREDLLGHLPIAWLIAIWLPAATTTGCTLWAAIRGLVEDRPFTLPRGLRIAVLATSHVAALLLGLYVGALDSGIRGSSPTMPSALAHLEDGAIAEHLDHDLLRLRTAVEGMAQLTPRMLSGIGEIRAEMKCDDRTYLLPAEDEATRWLFVTYLSYRTALLRLAGTHAGFEAIRDPARRAQSFMLGYAAAMAVHRSGLGLVNAYGDHELVRRKLNEAEPAWGIPAGMFDRVLETVSAARHNELCEEMAAYFELHRDRWRDDLVWPDSDFTWLETEIKHSLEAVRNARIGEPRRWFDLVVERVRQDAYTPMYAAQSMVADWIGDIRVIDRPRFIGPDTVAEVAKLMQPGDIILERRSWNASNAFLPGFWPHAALYVGTPNDLAELAILERPDVASRFDEYSALTPDGHHHTVIEALGEGVIFNSLEESLHADYAAVLRPRLTTTQIAEAIERAFRHQGKPYDFEFDFFTSDKLVCTELVYRSFQGLLDFELVHVMGRDTLPAMEFVRTWERERNSDQRQLDLVFFLDADPARQRVFFADEQAFVDSMSRKREFNE